MSELSNILLDDEYNLSDRERAILTKIVHLYILNANPIGSRYLSKYLKEELNLSPATIRNVMADLEELNYIKHPHTSAGRVPTDKGYRFYVDTLNKLELTGNIDIPSLKDNIKEGEVESVLKNASKLLGMLSKYLGVVQIPIITDLIVEKIEIIPVSNERLLVIIALDSNIVRTVTLEAAFDIESQSIKDIISYINEKISGKPLRFLKENFDALIVDFDVKDTPLFRLFTESIDKLFSEYKQDRVLIAGTQNILEHPEFEDLSKVKSVIELVENEDIIIHILDKYEKETSIDILIGKEMQNDMLNDYSIVKSTYLIGGAKGNIGLIGPKRMDYAKMISIVHSVSTIINEIIKR
jgi:heat-inducible transcriptional repressor